MPKSHRRCLSIGINYYGTSNKLEGCINDSFNTKEHLMKLGFQEDEFVMMNDSLPKSSPLFPTRGNIITQIKTLVGTSPEQNRDTVLVFHYSGHGGQQRDSTGDELDKQDECIYPVDFTVAGSLLDDDFKKLFDDSLIDPTCKVIRICDSCHSGTMGDEKFNYTYTTSRDLENQGVPAFPVYPPYPSFTGYPPVYSTFPVYSIYNYSRGVYPYYHNYYNPYYPYYPKPTKPPATTTTKPPTTTTKPPTTTTTKPPTSATSVTEEVSTKYTARTFELYDISGCLDTQTSADAFINNKAQGACTFYLWQVMDENNSDITFETLLVSMNDKLKKAGYSQRPKLSSGQKLDLKVKFSFL